MTETMAMMTTMAATITATTTTTKVEATRKAQAKKTIHTTITNAEGTTPLPTNATATADMIVAHPHHAHEIITDRGTTRIAMVMRRTITQTMNRTSTPRIVEEQILGRRNTLRWASMP